jgi:hypothetical protein
VNARGDAYARKPEDILNLGYLITIIHKNSGKLSTAAWKASAPYVYVPRHFFVKSCLQYMEACMATMLINMFFSRVQSSLRGTLPAGLRQKIPEKSFVSF